MISKNYFFSFKESDMEISADEIIKLIDGGHKMIRTDFKQLITDLLEQIPGSYDYKGELNVFYDPVFIEDLNILRIMNTDFRLSEILFNEMMRSEMTALFVCTAGNLYSDLSTQYNKDGDLIMSYIVDIAGNIAVRKIAYMIHCKLTEDVSIQGMKTTNYYCPGNCGWRINDQQKLFMLVNGDFSGIKLTADNLMQPLKSLSGIIGIGKHVFFRENTCELCGNKNCIYRDKSAYI